jgi:hypothetical protein
MEATYYFVTSVYTCQRTRSKNTQDCNLPISWPRTEPETSSTLKLKVIIFNVITEASSVCVITRGLEGRFVLSVYFYQLLSSFISVSYVTNTWVSTKLYEAGTSWQNKRLLFKEPYMNTGANVCVCLICIKRVKELCEVRLSGTWKCASALFQETDSYCGRSGAWGVTTVE